jgi:hypothetical protein
MIKQLVLKLTDLQFISVPIKVSQRKGKGPNEQLWLLINERNKKAKKLKGKY